MQWKASQKTDVKNPDLWKRLDDYRNSREVWWGWVQGHVDNPYNNLVDELAVRATPRKTVASDAAEAVVDMPAISYSSTTSRM